MKQSREPSLQFKPDDSLVRSEVPKWRTRMTRNQELGQITRQHQGEEYTAGLDSCQSPRETHKPNRSLKNRLKKSETLRLKISGFDSIDQKQRRHGKDYANQGETHT